MPINGVIFAVCLCVSVCDYTIDHCPLRLKFPISNIIKYNIAEYNIISEYAKNINTSRGCWNGSAAHKAKQWHSAYAIPRYMCNSSMHSFGCLSRTFGERDGYTRLLLQRPLNGHHQYIVCNINYSRLFNGWRTNKAEAQRTYNRVISDFMRIQWLYTCSQTRL